MFCQTDFDENNYDSSKRFGEELVIREPRCKKFCHGSENPKNHIESLYTISGIASDRQI